VSPEMPPTLILCDWAEVVNGKINIMGAGINNIVANTPIPTAIAVYWFVGWDQANRKQSIDISLATEDGEPFLDPTGLPFQIQGDMEVGRPPGVKPGTPLPCPLAFKVSAVPYPAGGYVWTMRINGTDVATAPFTVVGG
jgi:hypothetical protein